MAGEHVHTTIYRSKHKPGLYLYLAEADKFDVVPPAIMQGLGALERSMSLELHEDRTLARCDVVAVMHNLQQHGFHIQLPPKDFNLEDELQKII
jgi:uncharacterized protein YcgL (UPF0745 family)